MVTNSILLPQVRYYNSSQITYAMALLFCIGIKLVLQSIAVLMTHPLTLGAQVKEQVSESVRVTKREATRAEMARAIKADVRRRLFVRA